MEACAEIAQNIMSNVRRVITGKDEQIKLVVCCWAAGGHLLIEDTPGTGKTMLARAIAKSVDGEFKRVQFTPDLLPSDILGTSIYNQSSGSFDFIKGPLFTTLFLGDEINRATPRTQSALLESMAEGQITTDGETRALSPLFFVMATQNPIEQQGTFPLPEAQLDRFMMKIGMGYPSAEDEIAIVKKQNAGHPIQTLQAVESMERFQYVREMVSRVRVSEPVFQYVSKIVGKTRGHSELRFGASPRATIAVIRASQAMALINGREYVDPSDVFHLIQPVIAHRLSVAPEARLEGKTAELVLESIKREIPVPVN